MCGIAGIYKLKGSKASYEDIRRIATKLLSNLSVRGIDAAGIAAINTTTKTVRILKAPIPSTKFITTKEYKDFHYSEEDLILLHSRAATQGDPKDNNNNHPLHSTVSNAVLIHNGILYNFKSLKKREKLPTKKDEVDSKIILDLYDKYLDIHQVIPRISGSCAMALYTKRRLYLYRHENPLVIAYLPELELIIFASTKAILQDSIDQPEYKVYFNFFFERIKHLPKHIIYQLEENELVNLNFHTQQIKSRKIKTDETVRTYKATTLDQLYIEPLNPWKDPCGGEW
jgi:glucosamine 6-phosphate synthetase-like amidotransferase/phosphosugar isomerase protein